MSLSHLLLHTQISPYISHPIPQDTSVLSPMVSVVVQVPGFLLGLSPDKHIYSMGVESLDYYIYSLLYIPTSSSLSLSHLLPHTQISPYISHPIPQDTSVLSPMVSVVVQVPVVVFYTLHSPNQLLHTHCVLYLTAFTCTAHCQVYHKRDGI